MKSKRSVTEVARNFADYLNRVVYKGESFLLVRGRKEVAELVPVSHGSHLGELPEILRSVPHLSREEADNFSHDLSNARDELSSEGLRDPWQS